MGFKEQIKKVKEKEAYISYELYYLLRNVITGRLVYEDSRCEFKGVLLRSTEFPVVDKRADLVIFATKYGRAPQPRLLNTLKLIHPHLQVRIIRARPIRFLPFTYKFFSA